MIMGEWYIETMQISNIIKGRLQKEGYIAT